MCRQSILWYTLSVHEQRGFTLLEVIVAVGILAVVTLIVVGVILTAQLGGTSTHETTVATSLAEGYVDELKRGSFSLLEDAIAAPIVASRDIDGREHQLSTEVSRLSVDPSDPDHRVLHLDCTVSWQGRAVEGKERQARVRLHTHVAAAARY